jgi:hypothetical protein
MSNIHHDLEIEKNFIKEEAAVSFVIGAASAAFNVASIYLDQYGLSGFSTVAQGLGGLMLIGTGITAWNVHRGAKKVSELETQQNVEHQSRQHLLKHFRR